MKTKVSTPHSFLSAASRSLSAVGLIAVFACGAAAQQWTGPDNNNISNANSGNVGIGTSNPSSKLHVQRDVNGDNAIHVLNNGGGTSSRSLILFGEAASDAKYSYFGHFGANYAGSGPAQPRSTLFVGADAGGFNLVSYGGASETGGKISFWTSPVAAGGGNAAVAERMRITSNGNVGIGTASPGSKLEINLAGTEGTGLNVLSGASNKYALIQWGRTSAEGTLAISRSAGAFFTNSVAGDAWFGSTNGTIAFGDQTAGTANLIVKSGNVGIGTTSPAEKLHVAGSIRVDGNINAKDNFG